MHTGAPVVVGGSDGGEKLNLYGAGEKKLSPPLIWKIWGEMYIRVDAEKQF